MTTYISLTDTANMIRKTLKIEFPGIKFSVKTRRFANGTACDIRWVDGPTSREVDDVVGFYSGSTFDPMIDLSSSKTHTNEGGEEIHYGAKYVTTRREYSNGFFQHMIDYATATYAFTEEPEFELVDGGKFEGFIKGNDNARFGNEWAVNFLMNLCYKTNANNLPVIPVKEVAAVEVAEAVERVTVEVSEVQPAAVTERHYFQQMFADDAPAYSVGDTVTYMTISGSIRTVVVTVRCPDTLRNEGFRGIDSRGYAVWGYDSDILSVTPVN